MKRILIWSLALVISILFLGYYFYHYEEAKYYKHQRAYCELSEIAILLNNIFLKNKKYPNKENWVNAISSDISNVKCKRLLTIKNGVIHDLWGDEYKYEYLSGNNIVFDSVNLENKSLKLLDGKIFTIHSGKVIPDSHN